MIKTKSFPLALAIALMSAAPALAHAIVVKSTPAEGETLRGPDFPVEVRFNSRIDGKRSRVTLVRPDGSSAALPLAAAAPDTLRAEAVGLASGAYRLHWQTLSVDGHLTQGDITFRVGE